MVEIGPGTALICIKWDMPEDADDVLTVGALYFCEEVIDTDPYICPWDGCGTIGIGLKGKACSCCNKHYPYCVSLFRPLNDGDTSLVETEKELANV